MPLDKEVLESYLNKGISCNKIAKELNTSTTNLRYYLKKYGLTTNPIKNKLNNKNCLHCNKELVNNQNKYCSKKCKQAYHTNKYKGLTQQQVIEDFVKCKKYLITNENGFSVIKDTIIIDSKYKNLFKNVHIHNGYPRVTYNYRPIGIHRIIYYLETGIHSDRKNYIDHINLNKLDNRFENLRIVTISESNCNRGKTKNKKNSKYKGVHKTIANTYQVQVWHNGKNVGYGTFKTEEEAALKYNEVVKEIYGNTAYLNKINLFPKFEYLGSINDLVII